MTLYFKKITFLFLIFSLFTSLEAKVVGFDIEIHEDVLNGYEFGETGAYEKFLGTIFFEVDPANLINHKIVDIEYAPLNTEGMVEFSANFTFLKPKNMDKSNGTTMLGIANRGTRRMLTFFNHADATDGGVVYTGGEYWDAANPTIESDFGDGFLMENGFSLFWVGWQFDVPARRAAGSRIFIPRLESQDPINGLVRSDFVVTSEIFDRTLADRGHIPYSVSDPDSSQNTLTVRDSVVGERRIIPRDQWAFARLEEGRVVPDMSRVYLSSGFQPKLIYEVVYVSENPEIIGLGLAAIRDVSSALKYDSLTDLNLTDDSIDHVIAYGMSQPGRTLRTYLYMGFNEDESNRKALDGVIAQIGGAARGSFNLRFGQASRDAHPFLNFFYPTDIFPFTDIEQTDPLTGITDGVLSHLPEEFMPKIYNVNSSYEYWGRVVSLLTTSVDGSIDVPLLDDYSRVYHLSGAQHLPSDFPPSQTNGQNLNNPNDFSWLMRSLLLRMHDWVANDIPAPPSRYPLLSDGSLVEPAMVNFPQIPNINFPTKTHKAYRVDYGPFFATDGVITKEPPDVGEAFPVFVPQVDEDGNEIGGLKTLGHIVPLATYTGWNLYNSDYGPTDTVSHMSGSFLPFPKDRETRLSSDDPRLSIEERYDGLESYLDLLSQEAKLLIEEGYLLESDLPAILEQATDIWEYVIR